MSNKYYDSTGKNVANLDTSDETDINDINQALQASFDLVEEDLGSSVTWANTAHRWAEEEEDTEVDAVNYPGEYSAHHWVYKAEDAADLASDWASTTGVTIDGGSEYSAKEWAIGTVVPSGSAKDWAITAENTYVTGTSYSALHHAAKAAASAASASSSASTATTQAGLSAGSASDSSGYADDSLASANLAEEWAEKAEDSEVTPGSYSALHWAAKAATTVTDKIDGPASSVDSQLVLFDGVTGKAAKAATTNGILKGTSGVLSAAVSGTDIKTINSTSVIGSGNIDVQPTLVSGTNIKTINSVSLVGSGNVAVQPTLVSGTNIKTVHGVSLLGSGDVPNPIASSTTAGVVELATTTETQTGTDATKAVTPDGLDSCFARSKTTIGYQKLPGGVIIQWGRSYYPDGAQVFPVAFPSACRAVTGNYHTTGSTDLGFPTVTATGFTPSTSGGSVAYYWWIAIGY